MELILYVEDVNAQVEFYRDTVDLKVRYPWKTPRFSTKSWVKFDTGECTLVRHAGGRVGEDAPKMVFQVSDVAEVGENLPKKVFPWLA